jgi:hypothetical protein
MQDAFPITGRGFIPVKELEKNNKTWIEAIKKRIEEEEKARLEAEEAAAAELK